MSKAIKSKRHRMLRHPLTREYVKCACGRDGVMCVAYWKQHHGRKKERAR